jgi:hypothetical protein
MPRDGAIIFSDLIGKLAVPFIHWNKALANSQASAICADR